MGSHDKLFKAVFSEPENAVAHFERFLPAALTDALDLSKAHHEPGSFVDETLSERHTDLLYRIPWRRQSDDTDREVLKERDEREVRDEHAERELLLYVLFEHQSSVDHLMSCGRTCRSSGLW